MNRLTKRLEKPTGTALEKLAADIRDGKVRPLSDEEIENAKCYEEMAFNIKDDVGVVK